MNKRVLMACLATLVFASRADAITFFNVQLEANAVAISSDGVPGVDSQSGATDPVSASAASIGTADVATAGAIAGLGLLTTSADVSAGNLSNAVATSRFAASFLNAGPVSLSVDFTPTSFAAGSGSATTTLFLSLTSNGATLFSDYVTGPWQYAYTPAAGTTSLLDMTMSSEVNAAFLSAGLGDASSAGVATITAAVPETSTWLMFSLGLGGMGVFGARARRKAEQA